MSIHDFNEVAESFLKTLEDNNYEVGTPEPLFMRIDKDKLFEELGVNE